MMNRRVIPRFSCGPPRTIERIGEMVQVGVGAGEGGEGLGGEVVEVPFYLIALPPRYDQQLLPHSDIISSRPSSQRQPPEPDLTTSTFILSILIDKD